MPSLLDWLERVDDRESFIDFLDALVADQADASARESAQPAGTYDERHNGWEARTLDEYLEALAHVARDNLRTGEVSWWAMATLLYEGRRGPLDLRRRRAAARRSQEHSGEVVLRLDEESARLLYGHMTDVGEHWAAGVDVPRLPWEQGRRLGAIYDDLGGQLGIASEATSMRREFERRRREQRAQQAEPGSAPSEP